MVVAELPVAAESAAPSAVASAAPSAATASAAPSAAASAGASAEPSSAPSGAVASGAPASPAASGAAGECPPASGTVIALDETADLAIQQNGQDVPNLNVKKGDTITFQITNTAGFTHDFYIGPTDKLSQNQTAGLPGVPEFQSGTQTFTYTVTDETATLQFGCTVPGHFAVMHGTVHRHTLRPLGTGGWPNATPRSLSQRDTRSCAICQSG